MKKFVLLGMLTLPLFFSAPVKAEQNIDEEDLISESNEKDKYSDKGQKQNTRKFNDVLNDLCKRLTSYA